MPYNWNPRLRAEAIQILVENMGSTWTTSQQTGIPERTIQEWKHHFYATQNIQTILMERETTDPLEAAARERYLRLRANLLEHIEKLSERFRSKPEQAVDLAIAMSRLIDRLHKLEYIIQPHHFSLVILYEHPDGTIQDKPADAETSQFKPVPRPKSLHAAVKEALADE
jgi:hypothetical protein